MTFTVEAGEAIELTGANGVGKSTLLRTLAGLYGQYTGTYVCADFLYQGHRLGFDNLLTPLENLALFSGLAGQQLPRQRCMDLLDELQLLTCAHKPCGELSAGQQRRVAMVRWLLSPDRLWLLDEPLTALDVSAQTILNEKLQDHCDGGGVVICATHAPLGVTDRRELTLVPAQQDELMGQWA